MGLRDLAISFHIEPPPENLVGFWELVIFSMGKVESADLLAAPVDIESGQPAQGGEDFLRPFLSFRR